MPRYRIIETFEEDQRERELADLACAVAARELRISKPAVEFIVEDRRGDVVFSEPIFGFQKRRVVYIVAGIPPREIVATAAHECRHVKDFDDTRLLERERQGAWFERVFMLEFYGRSAAELTAELRRRLAPLKIAPSVRTRVDQRAEAVRDAYHAHLQRTPGTPERRATLRYEAGKLWMVCKSY